MKLYASDFGRPFIYIGPLLGAAIAAVTSGSATILYVPMAGVGLILLGRIVCLLEGISNKLGDVYEVEDDQPEHEEPTQ